MLTSLFAAVQLVLPVALSVAHATASSGLESPAHVEETSGSKCGAGHVDECIVCRHLSTSATKSPAPPSIAARSAFARPGAASALAGRSLSPHAFQSRAPPDLSA